VSVLQLELFAVDAAIARPQHSLGPRGFPMCAVCRIRESIGPRHIARLDLCTGCWTPVLDPIGAAAWDRIEAERAPVETVPVAGGVL
jgi:hypothetical protein